MIFMKYSKQVELNSKNKNYQVPCKVAMEKSPTLCDAYEPQIWSAWQDIPKVNLGRNQYIL